MTKIASTAEVWTANESPAAGARTHMRALSRGGCLTRAIPSRQGDTKHSAVTRLQAERYLLSAETLSRTSKAVACAAGLMTIEQGNL